MTYTVYLDPLKEGQTGPITPTTKVCEGTTTSCDPLPGLAPDGSPIDLAPATHYYWQVQAIDSAGNASLSPLFDFVTSGCPKGQYRAEYSKGSWPGTSYLVRCESPVLATGSSVYSRDWGTGGPGLPVTPWMPPGTTTGYLGTDDFSLALEGTFDFPSSAGADPAHPSLYGLFATSDDGVRVFLDGVSVVDAWDGSAPSNTRSRPDDRSGRARGEGRVPRGDWISAAQSGLEPARRLRGARHWSVVRAVLPEPRPRGSALARRDGGSHDDDALCFTSGETRGPAELPSDDFSAIYAGKVHFDGGTYRFLATSDDGVRLYLDGALLVDGWGDQSSTSHYASKAISAGEHDVRIEYYEATDSATLIVSADSCYALALSHSGNGGNPTAYPANSAGCPTGQYVSGEGVALTAHPSPGYAVSAWSGTTDDTGTSLTSSLTMLASPHTVSVSYTPICYALGLGHTGAGGNPTASPASSPGCSVGQYITGEQISLRAYPDAGFQVSAWSGTTDDTSKALTSAVTMPSGPRTVSVAYTRIPQVNFLPTPTRFVDTRDGSGGRLQKNVSRCFQIAGREGVPSGAQSAILNLTVVNHAGDGWIAAYPSDGSFTGTSSLNFDRDENSIANFAIVKLGTDGKACLLASESTDAIVDVSGYTVAVPSPQIALLPAPRRVVDTRSGSSYLGAGQPLQGISSPRCYTLAGRVGVPADAQAVVVNLTAVGYTRDGWIAAYPYDPAKLGQVPATSSVNFDVQENAIANFAIVKLGQGGQVCLTGSVSTNAIVDVSGYLMSTAGGQVSFSSSPVRVVDTRAGSGYLGAGQPLQGTGDPHSYQLAGQGVVPSDAQAVIVNLTAVGYTRDGWIAAYPSGGSSAATSSVNYDTDENAIANFAIAKLGPDGKLVLLGSSRTNAIVDVVGYLR